MRECRFRGAHYQELTIDRILRDDTSVGHCEYCRFTATLQEVLTRACDLRTAIFEIYETASSDTE